MILKKERCELEKRIMLLEEDEKRLKWLESRQDKEKKSPTKHLDDFEAVNHRKNKIKVALEQSFKEDQHTVDFYKEETKEMERNDDVSKINEDLVEIREPDKAHQKETKIIKPL